MSRSLKGFWKPSLADRKALAAGKAKLKALRDAKRFGSYILAAGPL
jgi:hypothetical protein